ILNGLIFTLITIGTLIMIPNLIAAILAKSTLIITVNIIISIVILFLAFKRDIKHKYKVRILIIFFYILGIVLLVDVGPLGPGLIWLASSSFIAALLIDLKSALYTVAFNLLIIVVLAVLINLQLFDTPFFNTYTVLAWIAVSSNFIIFNLLTSIPFSIMIRELTKTNIAEKNLRIELSEKNKRIESEKNKAQESEIIKTNFLANLSHEIRTPMNAIVGFSELINDETKKDERLHKFSDQVVLNANYLLNLINDIVDTSLIDADHLQLNYTITTIDVVIAEVKSIVETSELYKKRPETIVRYNVDPMLITNPIHTDKTRLKQILMNLISNALKYTPKGEVLVKVYGENELMHFEVIDSGVGIPMDQQDKIFKRFSKINREGTFKMPGIGLGLSITKALCIALRGTIDFLSDEKNGTTFHFTIPMDIHNNL
ncbi:MAG: HAMP domain-containing sensor histidine kinase, partial [Prolixibacteraceae bacterium]|nr:HAMP domain-containing sensor histidine kinase [Prolixibacteraceae bacterium]